MARSTFVEELVEALGQEIASGRYAAEDALNTEALAERFEVSRTVVREATKILESMGLVAVRRKTGLRVRPAHDWNMLDPNIIRWRLSGPERVTVLRSLTSLRAAIEPAAARQAAQTGAPEARGRLVAAAQGMRGAVEAGDHDRFVAEDTTFHETLVAASGNDFFAALSRSITGVILGQTRSGVLPAEGDRSVQLHTAIAEAVSAGQEAAAETAARALFTEMDKDLP